MACQMKRRTKFDSTTNAKTAEKIHFEEICKKTLNKHYISN
jgi:hypothetical protein